MKLFTKCSVLTVRYRSHTIVNNPVNLMLCQSIRKSRLKYYPDNDGCASIVFHGCDTEWAFGSDQARDEEYEHLLERSV